MERSLSSPLLEKHCREMLASAIEQNKLRRTAGDLSDDILASLEEQLALPGLGGLVPFGLDHPVLPRS